MKTISAKRMIQVIRAPFFTAVIIPVWLGALIAWRDGFFHWGYLLLTLLGMICVNAGLNLSNDYFDHLSGNDELNQELTPFSGGSRTIQQGILPARRVLLLSVLFYLTSIAIGIYLVAARGQSLLWLGLFGLFLAFFHNAPPIRFYHLGFGVGELAAGIGCGPLIVLGSYYVQAQRLSYEALWASIPLALLITAVLYINEFPDVEADRRVGKRTLPVMLGKARAVWGYGAIIVGAYVLVLVGIMLGVFPFPLVIALFTIPLAYRGIRQAVHHHSDTPKLIPALAITVQLHLTTGVLLCFAYLIAITL